MTPDLQTQPVSETAERYEFTILLPVPFEGHIRDKHNPSADELKTYLGELTDDTLKLTQLGQLATALVQGKLSKLQDTHSAGLYTLAEGGRGITFDEPDKLYNEWQKEEHKVGPKFQEAMRKLIDSAMSREPQS